MKQLHLIKKICLILLVVLPLLLFVPITSNAQRTPAPGGISADVEYGQVILAWDANKESDLAGYKLHYGPTSGRYSNTVDVKNVTQYTISAIPKGIKYFYAATAYNTEGAESGYSIEINYIIPLDEQPLPDPASGYSQVVECEEDPELPGSDLEAEGANLSGSVQVGTDVNGVKYVFSSIPDRGYITFTFDISTSGEYLIDARVNSRGQNWTDSFYVGFIREDEIRINHNIYDTTKELGFVWDAVSIRGSTGTFDRADHDPMVWDLSAGTHTLLFAVRERNTWLDKIRIRKKE